MCGINAKLQCYVCLFKLFFNIKSLFGNIMLKSSKYNSNSTYFIDKYINTISITGFCLYLK